METPVPKTLSPAERRELKGRAHAQKAVVMIGGQGLTPAVFAEIGRALEHHELIKIRVAADDREARAAWLAQICAETGAAPVQHIGKMLVIFKSRPAPEPSPPARPRKARSAGARSFPPSRPAPRRKPPERIGLFESRKPDLKRVAAGPLGEEAYTPGRRGAGAGARPKSARPGAFAAAGSKPRRSPGGAGAARRSGAPRPGKRGGR